MSYIVLVIRRDLAVDVLTFHALTDALAEMKLLMQASGVLSVRLFTSDWTQIISMDRGGAVVQVPAGVLSRG
ncbi:MAG: hypothetical protein ACREJ8_09120 [Candidatus Methylomirabilales bacterium]